VKALQVKRSAAKFGLARIASAVAPATAARIGPLEYASVDEPELPGEGWVRLRPRLSGICGSDLALLEGKASTYFDPIVSFPFTPGHEVVADVLGGELSGRRAVVIPILTCAVRGIEPVCHMCAGGRQHLCERIAFGHLAPGLQCGFCTDTGGGWGPEMVAHERQLVEVPDDFTDEQAVMIEPMACAVHATASWSEETIVIGAGTLGLLTLASIAHQYADLGDHRPPVLIAARYSHQHAIANAIAAAGAISNFTVTTPPKLAATARLLSRSHLAGDQLTCGFDHVIDCVGSSESITQAMQIVAPGGTIVLMGMPGQVSLDLTSVWHREVAIRGTYAYEPADFQTAIEIIRRFDLGRLVSATYPLEQHVDAIAHAASAGRRGAVKIAFDLREKN
jgi:threonine dehydrogenase-like Zn-dependent dehydrogenase